MKSVKARALATREVASALGLRPATVQRYAREGRIPFDETPGGHRRFDLDEVRDALGMFSGPAPADEDRSQIRERLRWTPAQRLAYLVDMADFEDAVARGRSR